MDAEPGAAWWAAAAEGRLVFQWCAACGVAQHPPRPVCPRCHSAARLEWRDHDGRGVIHTLTEVHTTTYSAFADRLPFVIAVAALEPELFVVANVPFGTRREDVTPGTPVRITLDDAFSDVDGHRLPMIVPEPAP